MPLADAITRALELLRALGIEHRAHALPRELSGGEANAWRSRAALRWIRRR